ncbi:MAG TPA: hypothetical protein VH083_22505 [Myxococcales bacterium]|nr:hypothetical protein [Myxococcales bacterium]
MSTGADAKTMPVTTAYEDGHERIFGPSAPVAQRTARRVYVSRCAACDGVTFEPGALLFDCRRCGGKNCYGLVDTSVAPPLREEHEARSAPIMVDRFMEGSVAQDGTDIGSRRKRKDYLKATGATDASDFGPGYGQRVRTRREEEVSKQTRETVARIAWTDPRWKP